MIANAEVILNMISAMTDGITDYRIILGKSGELLAVKVETCVLSVVNTYRKYCAISG